MAELTALCPCGSNRNLTDCCGRYLDGHEIPPSAEAIMRSRYTAFTLNCEDYLLATWHPSTRPEALGLKEEVANKWIGLDIKRSDLSDAENAIVEFVARYKVNGRAQRLHEISRFVREEGRWFYVDGDLFDH